MEIKAQVILQPGNIRAEIVKDTETVDESFIIPEDFISSLYEKEEQ